MRVLALILLLAGGTYGAELFVAPDGSNTNPGTRSQPFKTLEAARDAARKLAGPKTVFVRGGAYELERTLQLNSQDSGVTWRAYQNEKPVLIGGRQITGFTNQTGNIRKAPGIPGVYFRQLFCGSQRQHLARYPNFDVANLAGGGWAYAAGKLAPMYSDIPGESKRTLHFKPADARQWSRPTDGEVFVFPRFNWWNNIVPIQSVDPATQTITLASDCSYAIRPGDRYYVQNIFEELDAPGEWYLDKQDWTLYFWSPPALANQPVYAPTLRTILNIGPGTKDVIFRGFTFECCEGIGITLSDTTNCLIAASVIRNVGDYLGDGVAISGGTSNGVVGCDISEIGRAGIAITGGDRITLTPAGNFADNNYIHHVGVFYKQGVGIWLAGCGNRAAHNYIHDGPRFGIEFTGNNLLIEYNHIRHMDLETEDTGAVYTGGRDWIGSRGTVIRYNYFHDMLGYGHDNQGVWHSPYFAWGIYLDDNTGGVDVIGNIVARCPTAGLHLHNGRDNRIENNLFIDNGQSQVEYNGWTSESRMWKEHFPTMIKGYESVAHQPAWRNMRNMQTHPKDAILPEGLIMSGNTLTRNIFYYTDPAANLYHFSNVAFKSNAADSNLVWHCGRPIATGQFKAGKVISTNLLANPSFEVGPSNALPTAWIWQAQPSPSCKATVTDAIAAEGRRSLKIEGVAVKNATGVPPWPVIVSANVAAQPGHTYLLTAKMKAEKAGTHVELMIQSYLANVYFWCKSTAANVGTDWKEYELTFKLPAKGEQNYREQMRAVCARFDLSGGTGTLWVDAVRLVEVEAQDEWQSLQSLGFDQHSLVADPQFDNVAQADYRLGRTSPAFKLGFQPIPIEKIGPYKSELRASWPIQEAAGAREHPPVSNPPKAN